MDMLMEEKKRELNEWRQRSMRERDEYWSEVAEKLTWSKKWDKVCDLSEAPITKWFTGGRLNACYNCVDKQIIDGKGEKVALYFDSPVTKSRKTYTYNQIYDEVTRLAGLLEEFTVKKGDHVMIYMPMMAEGTLAMLACCRIGAVHICIPSGLPAQDLAVRMDHSKPKVILVASAGYHSNSWVNYKSIVDKALKKALHKTETVLVWRRQQITEVKVTMVDGKDIDWKEAVAKAKPKLECVPMNSNEPFFVIYTSGSTGEPKGIVHSVGGVLVKFFNDRVVQFGQDCGDNNEVYYFTSNYGWIMSHSLIYGCLLTNVAVVIFEDDSLLASDPNALYSIVQNNKVTRLLVRPGLMKLLRQMDNDGKVASKYDLKSLRQMYFGGEKLNRETAEYIVKIFGTTLCQGYGQTETGTMVSGSPNYAFAKNTRKIMYSTTPLPGYDVAILKPDQTIAKPNEVGRIAFRLPMPPGTLATLLGNHEKCETLYFSQYPGYFDMKDEGYLDDNGDMFVVCRADDIMKHRSVYLAAQAVEEIAMSHSEVAECLVISTPDLVLKEVPVTLYIPKKGSTNDLGKISAEIIERLSKHFGEAVTFGKVIPVCDLPRTRTGKIHRPSVAALGKGFSPTAIVTGAVENPEVLVEIGAALSAGFTTRPTRPRPRAASKRGPQRFVQNSWLVHNAQL